jgi:hypothetical protein
MRRLGGESEQARVRDRRKRVLGLTWVTGADLSVKRDPRVALAGGNLSNSPGFKFAGELAVKRILKPVTYALAILYFLADADFMAIAKPISDWLATHVVLRRLRAWIRSLRPYPSLALFSVPVIILEPVKPVAAYLAATGRRRSPTHDRRRRTLRG